MILVLLTASILCRVCANDNVVIDLKYLNENVDFARAKNAGVKGVIHMITMGSDFKDPTYENRKKRASEVGLLWGAYHIADGSPGTRQAANFLKNVGQDDSILLAIGIEKSNYSMSTEEADNFVKTVYLSRRRYPLVYGEDYMAGLVKENKDSLLKKCGLWKFQYENSVTVPQGWSNWTLWQYTDGVHGPEPRGVAGVGPCGRDTINTALHRDIESLWKAY